MAHEHEYNRRAVSSCQMLSSSYVCAIKGDIITFYTDNATGIMIEQANGGGRFKAVTLNPVFYLVNGSMEEKAIELHSKAYEICYIANCVNFVVKCNPTCKEE